MIELINRIKANLDLILERVSSGSNVYLEGCVGEIELDWIKLKQLLVGV